jgi:hypothetical protein
VWGSGAGSLAREKGTRWSVTAGWLEAVYVCKVLDERKLMRVDQDGPCLGIGRLVWHGRGAGVVAC